MVAVSVRRLWPRAPRSTVSEVRLGRDWRPQAAAWSPALAFRVAGAVQDAKAPLQPSYELARTAKAKADDGPHTQASSRRRREGPCGSAGPPAATAPRALSAITISAALDARKVSGKPPARHALGHATRSRGAATGSPGRLPTREQQSGASASDSSDTASSSASGPASVASPGASALAAG